MDFWHLTFYNNNSNRAWPYPCNKDKGALMIKIILFLLIGILVGIGLSMAPKKANVDANIIIHQDSTKLSYHAIAQAVENDAKEVGLICSSNRTNVEPDIKITS